MPLFTSSSVVRSGQCKSNRRRVGQALVVAISLSAVQQAMGQTLYWDGDGISPLDGGNGNWDLATPNWNLAVDGSGIYTSWLNGSDAVFGDVAGTVAVLDSIVARGATFNADGYLLNGAGSLSLAASNFVSVGPAFTTTIQTKISGTNGLRKIGAGTLLLSGLNDFTGVLSMTAGTVAVNDDNFAANNATVSFAGGTLYTSSSFTLASGRAYVLAGNGTFNVASGATLTSPAAISGTGTLNKVGAGVLALTVNATFTGNALIREGTLSVAGVPTGFPAVSNPNSVILDGGALRLDQSTAFSINRGINITGAVGTLDVNGAGTSNTWSGVISGTGALSKSGPGSLTIYGINTYSGGTSIDGGTLNLSADNNLGTAPAVFTADSIKIANGARLRLNSSATLNANRGITLSTFGASVETLGGYNLTIPGNVTGGPLTKLGSGTLTLTGVNAFAGPLTISGGIVAVNSANTGFGTNPGSATPSSIVMDGGGIFTTTGFSTTLNSFRGIAVNGGGGTIGAVAGTTFTYGGIVAGSGALTTAGTGTVSLSGVNTFSGPTTISGNTLALNGTDGAFTSTTGITLTKAGTLRLDNTAAINNVRIPAAAPLGLNGATLSFVANQSAVNSQSIGAITLTAGRNAIVTSVGTAGGNIASTVATSLTLSATGQAAQSTVDFNIAPGTSFALTSAPTLTNNIIGGYATFADVDWATYAGGTIAALPSASYYTNGATTGWDSVHVRINSSVVGTPQVGSNRTPYTLIINDTTARSITINGGVTLNVGQGGLISNGGAHEIKLTSGTTAAALSSGSAAGSKLNVNVPSGSLTVSIPIVNNAGGAVGIVKSGAGSILLNSSNTYTGGTVVNGGIARFTLGDGPTPVSGTFSSFGSYPATAGASGTILLNGGGIFTGAAGLYIGANRTITLGENGGTFGGSNTGTINAVITGVGDLTKSVAGINMNLFAVNNFTGRVFVTGGSLTISSDTSLGAVPASFRADSLVLDAGTLQINAGIALADNRGVTLGSNGGTFANSSGLTIGGAVSGAGALYKTGAGSVTFSGRNSYAGGTTIVGGGLLFNNVNGAGTGPIVVTPATNSTLGQTTSGGAVVLLPNNLALNVGAADINLYVTTGNNLTMTGIVSGSGPFFVSKGNVGQGSIILNNFSNSFSGLATIAGGELIAAANGAFGSTSTAITMTAGAVGFQGGINYTSVKPLLIIGTGQSARGAIENTGGTNLFAGPVTLLGDSSLGVTIASDALTLSGQVGGAFAVNKVGPGRLILQAGNLYSAGTTVSAGTLQMADTNAVGTGGVVINGGVLAGTGTVGGAGITTGAATSGSGISPGTSIGSITTSSLAMTSNATFTIEIQGTTGAGVTNGNDVVYVTSVGSSVTLGNAKLQILALSPFSPAYETGQTFKVIDGAPGTVIGGFFSTLAGVQLNNNDSFTAAGTQFMINYDGGDVTLTTVPEPTTLSLLGVAGLGLLRRRRAAK